jgi:outer membrane protein assembly factor BamB
MKRTVMLRSGLSSGLRLRARRGALVILIAALTLLLAATACGASPTITTPTATSTPQEHGALYVIAGNQGPAGPASATVYALGLSDGKLLWHNSQLSGVVGTAALGGGTLYVGSVQRIGSGPSQGTFAALNASTGALLWHHTPSAGFELPLAANGDAVFADEFAFLNTQAPPMQTLQALRASDGTPLWSAAQNGSVNSLATVGNGALYLVTSSGATATSTTPPTYGLLALDTGTGKPLWHLALQGPMNAPTPVLSGGVLYLSEEHFQGVGLASILAVRASDGTVLWHTPLVGKVPSGGVVVSDGTVCYSSGGGIVALHAADGSLSWQTSTQFSNGPVSLASSDNSTIYALHTTTTKSQSGVSVATTLLAFDASSGKSLLTHPFPSLPIQAEFENGVQPQVAGGVLYVVGIGVPTQENTTTAQPQTISIVLALNASDGSLKWDRTLNGAAEQVLFVAP